MVDQMKRNRYVQILIRIMYGALSWGKTFERADASAEQNRTIEP